MVLRKVADHVTSEDVEDLRVYMTNLPGAPEINETVVLGCANHGDERPTWTYIEADARGGVARRRCLQCAQTVHLLDSESRWTHPPMWQCGSCSQSIGEVVAALSVPDGTDVTWLAVGVRCVECGRVDGLTDMVLPGTPLNEVLAAL